MKHLPKLSSLAAAGAITLSLAPIASGQTRVWTTESLGPIYERVVGLASNSAGDVFQAARTGPSSSTLEAAKLTCYRSDGELVWTRSIGNNHTFPSDLSPDGTGGVFMIGTTNEDLLGLSTGRPDAWVAHYDVQGERIWFAQIGSDVIDLGTAVAHDGAGGVFLAGSTDGSFGGPNQGQYDAWVARYDAAGAQLWNRQFGTTEDDTVTAVALDSLGGVIVGAFTGTEFSPGIAYITRFDADGTRTWTSQLGSVAITEVSQIVGDATGGVFMAGRTNASLAGQNAGGADVWFAHYDATGAQTWIRQLGSAAFESSDLATLDGSGGAFFGGFTGGDIGAGGLNAGRSWLVRYDAGGNEVWSTQFGAERDYVIHAGTQTHRGGVYVGGYIGGFGGNSSTWMGRIDDIGIETYCTPQAVNSTGMEGKISATGSGDIAANDVVLRADNLPFYSFGFFLASRSRDVVTFPGIPGVLCLGSPVGRYVAAGQIMGSGGSGAISLPIDLASMPQPTGGMAALPGESWHFQAWHRDSVGGAPTWGFTNAMSVMFR